MIPFSSSMLWTRSGHPDDSLQNVIIIQPTSATLTSGAGNSGGDDRLRPAFTIVIPGPRRMENKSAAVPVVTPKSLPLAVAAVNKGDKLLLDSLDCRSNRPLHAGPFLTVQRRRRRRKYVRTYLFKDPTLIDDLSSYQTNFVLDRINNWQFNAFILDNVTGGRPLPNLCVHLFKSYGLFDHFKLDPVIIWKLFSIIEDGYHWRNPYHNAVHAADVTQAMHCFLQEKFIREKLTPLEIFSAIVAAVTHDLDHPGVNQPFLVATSNHLASLYKNSSVLENHHWRSAMGCLNESGVTAILGPEVVAQVETQIKELVLATDITRQPDFLAQLRKHLEENTLDMNSPDIRQFVLQIALKCADISNPCRPWEISRKWSIKVCEEFFRQGDYERQLSLPVTPSFDRYTSSVPKIQIGFFNFIVEPLFFEWNRMMNTPLALDMMNNLNVNKSNWERLKVEETAPQPQGRPTQRELIEIPQHLIVDEDTISLNADIIAARKAFDGETVQQAVRAAEGSGGELHRSVRFDTTITTASDSENSEGDEVSTVSNALSRDFLVPRPDGRRHSIATGLMGSNIQLPPQLLSMKSPTHHGGSSHNISGAGDVSPSARMVGKTVIRRESLPGTLGPGGKTLSTKTILHLQKVSASAKHSDAGTGSDTDSESLSPMTGEAASEFSSHNVSAPIPVSPGRLVERSSCSSSTTDEILDFTYSLPETVMSGGGRTSGSPSRRLLHETTDFDELCPGTSILSMSPSVTQLQLQHGIAADLEEQRRHLIRQQTCPVVSLNADGSFNRPRFLSAAAAISPTTAATSQIISQKMKNRSPESSEREGEGQSQVYVPGRVSGASSSEALLCCEVISEEGDRQSSSSGESRDCSHEASPLEIFVQQFPPGSDDNDGVAPRRESGDTSSDQLSSSLTNISTYPKSTVTRNPSSFSSPDSSSATKLSLDDSSSPSPSHAQQKDKYHSGQRCTEFGHCEPEDSVIGSSGSERSSKAHQHQEIDRRQHERFPEESDKSSNTQQDHIIKLESTSSMTSNKKPLIITSTTQTRSGNDAQSQEQQPQNPSTSTKRKPEPDLNRAFCGPGAGGSSTSCPSSSMSPSSSSRIATILMWRNNKLWRSLTEEEADENNFVLSSLELQRRMYEKQLLPEYCTERWDLRFSQQLHQGVVGGRLQIRRGSAPTAAPAMGCRGAQDRRSDPTQYHSSSCLTTCQNNLNNLGLPFHTHDSLLCSCNYPQLGGGNKNQARRGSIPLELLKQTNLRPGPSNKKPSTLASKTARRGSLPCESAASNLESTYAHKWLHVFPYNEEDDKNAASLKRRSSGGPEIFAAAQRKISSSTTCTSEMGNEGWRTQILIEQFDVPETSTSSTATAPTAFWQGPRRGSLPVDVYRSSGGSCSSESESSGDASDT